MLFNRVESKKSLLSQLFFFFFWLAVTGIAIYLKPSAYGHGTHQELGLPPCPTVLIFNRPCPGCGLTTSFVALIHGNFSMAFRAHPLGPVLYVIFTLAAFLCLWGYLTENRFNAAAKVVQLPITAFVFVFIIFGVYRFATTPNYQTPFERTFASHIALR